MVILAAVGLKAVNRQGEKIHVWNQLDDDWTNL